eukprot:10592894-Ditylum_brightwellii.AAC.2
MSKEVGFGANTAVAILHGAMNEFDEAVDNFAYAATTSGTVLDQLTNNNTKLTQQKNDVMNVIKKL